MDEAEDAAQDVCCRVLSTKTTPEHFRAWIYRIARNHCLTLLRRRTRRQAEGHALPPASQIHELLTGQLTRLVQDEQRSKVDELVRSLSAEQQEVLRLRYVEELPRAEIAEILEIPQSVAKSRLFEGLRRLRASVDDVADQS
jgi:RNA polymerase sigma-70 factor (ECF subfamily)